MLYSNRELCVAAPTKIKHLLKLTKAAKAKVHSARRSAWRACWLCAAILTANPAAAGANAGVDVLGFALKAEFALQSGSLDAAASEYAKAAVQSQQVDLIERAATVALFAKDYDAAERVGKRWLALQPNAIGAKRTLAWVAMASARRADAEALLLELLADNSVDAQRAVAQVLVAAENRASAPQSLRVLVQAGALKPLSKGPNWSAVANNLGDKESAVQLAESETAANPKSAEAWRRRAQAQMAAGDSPQALKALEKALDLAPEDFELRLALAALHAQNGDVDRADYILAKADPQDDRALSARLANVASKPNAKLLKRIERSLRNSSRERVRSRAFLLGQLFELRKSTDLALSWYAQEPKGAAWHEAQLRRSVLLAREKNDLPGARALLVQTRLQVDDDQQRVDAYLLEAELLTDSDRAAALTVYDEALSLYQQDFRLLYARALFRIANNDVPGLEQDLRSILELDPENPQALNALGYTLADRTDRHQEALDYIQRAIAKQPDDAAFVDSMGWVQYRLGNLTKALSYLRRAYQLEPDGEVAAHLAEVLWMADKRDEATALWRAALQRWPNHPVLLESVKRLQPGLLP